MRAPNPNPIPFDKDFIPRIEAGWKTMTTRSRRYEPGIYWTVPGDIKIEIYAVRQETLGHIAEHFWEPEGCMDSADFIRIWRKLHRGHWNPKDVRWLHEFRLAEWRAP